MTGRMSWNVLSHPRTLWDTKDLGPGGYDRQDVLGYPESFQDTGGHKTWDQEAMTDRMFWDVLSHPRTLWDTVDLGPGRFAGYYR